MGEAVLVVCDVCGRPAVETITFKVGGRNLQKDLCQVHVSELTAGARPPRRGRRRGVIVPPPANRKGRPPKTTGSPAKGRGRPKKTTSARGRAARPSQSPTAEA